MSMDKLKRKWSELTLEEQNAFIAEQLFGREIFKERTWGRLLMLREDESGLTEAIPNYMQIMDAAWLVIQEMERHGELHSAFAYHLGARFATPEGFDTFRIGLELLASLTPEKICLAALKAFGVKIE